MLTKGIEATGRLVEDQELGIRCECGNEADLLLVPFREVADLPVQIELEPLGFVGWCPPCEIRDRVAAARDARSGMYAREEVGRPHLRSAVRDVGSEDEE